MKILNVTNIRTKEVLVQMINQVIDDNQWNNKKAAHMLQTSLADISLMKRSETTNFSLERLLIFLVRLDCKVILTINSKIRKFKDT